MSYLLVRQQMVKEAHVNGSCGRVLVVTRQLGLGPNQEILTNTSGPRPRTPGHQHGGQHGLHQDSNTTGYFRHIENTGGWSPWSLAPGPRAQWPGAGPEAGWPGAGPPPSSGPHWQGPGCLGQWKSCTWGHSPSTSGARGLKYIALLTDRWNPPHFIQPHPQFSHCILC